MVEQIVRKLSDGEELVIERASPTTPQDPDEKRIEARRLALDRDVSPLEGNRGSTTAARPGQRRKKPRAT